MGELPNSVPTPVHPPFPDLSPAVGYPLSTAASGSTKPKAMATL